MAAPIVLVLAAACLASGVLLTLYGLLQVGRGRRRAGGLFPPTPASPAAPATARTVVAAAPAQATEGPASGPWVHLDGHEPLPAEPGVLLNTLWELVTTAECQQGECGGCRLRLLEGEVRWIREPQVEIDRRTHVLACSCEPVGSVRCARP